MMRLSQQLFSDHKDHKISIFVEGFTPFVIVSLIALNIYSDVLTNNNKEILCCKEVPQWLGQDGYGSCQV